MWSIGAADGEHFAPSKSTFMVNYRVEDLAALMQVLRDEGCNVLEKTDDSEYGKFGWSWTPMAIRSNFGSHLRAMKPQINTASFACRC